MNSGPGRIWWGGDHARLNKRWRCSLAFISKSILDRHHQSKLKLKFNLCLSNFCHQNFQNLVTWGVEWRLRNSIFACVPMESLFSGVLPWGGTSPQPKISMFWALISKLSTPFWKIIFASYTPWPNKNASILLGIIFLKLINKNENVFHNNN